jgi:hypothetical protein
VNISDGGYPDIDKGGMITQEIFDNYHNVLYKGVTEYRDGYVLPTASLNNEIHLLLGLSLKTDDVNNDARTIVNATVQVFSILTLIVASRLYYHLKSHRMLHRVKIVNTVYDSIYLELDDDIELIKYLNDLIVPMMSKQYLEDEIVHNEAEADIGYDYYNMLTIPNNASIEEITQIKEKL